MPFQHVHLGAGALGLGLICPTVAAADGVSTILNRDSPQAADRLGAIAAAGGYYVHLYGEDEPTFVAVPQVATYAQADVAAIASDHHELLLTTALRRQGLDESIDFIREILEARGNMLTVVIACENQVDSHYLRDRLQERGFTPPASVTFIRSVVDRICIRPVLRDGVVEVACERFGRISVERSGLLSPLISGLVKRKVIEEVEDFDFAADRKKWLVNAPHLLMVLLAHYYRFPSVRDFTAERFGGEVLDRAVTEISQLAAAHFRRAGRTAPGLAAFAEGVKARLREFPQRYADVIRLFAGPERLVEFFDDYHRKITDLSLSDMKSEIAKAPYFLSLTTHVVVELIKERRWIRDAAAP